MQLQLATLCVQHIGSAVERHAACGMTLQSSTKRIQAVSNQALTVLSCRLALCICMLQFTGCGIHPSTPAPLGKGHGQVDSSHHVGRQVPGATQVTSAGGAQR
jgi:hypothetical protein